MEDQSTRTAVRRTSHLRGLALASAIVAICIETAVAQSSLRLIAEPGNAAPAAKANNSKSSAAPANTSVVSPGALGSDLYNTMFEALTGDAPPPVWHDTTVAASPARDKTSTGPTPPPREPETIEPEQFHYRIVLNIEPAHAIPDRSPDIAATPADNEPSAVPLPSPTVAAAPIEQVDVFNSLSDAAIVAPQACPPQPAPPTCTESPEPTLADITPIGVEPPLAAEPSPLISDHYPFAAVTDDHESPSWHDTDRARVATAPSPPPAPQSVEAKPIILAERPQRIAPSEPSPTIAMPSRLVLAPAPPEPEPQLALEPQPAPEPPRVPATPVYLSDATSAPSDGDDPASLPYGCPYYPCQSGTHAICGVDCGPHGAACCETWQNAHWIPWSMFGPGEYVGPPRPEHVPAYYLRVNDLITLTYIVSRQKQPDRYRIGVGDRLRIESGFDESIDREIIVQPDGDITLPLIGDVPAAGKTVQELRDDLIQRYGRIEREPLITVTPMDFNIGLREILIAVTSQSNRSGQALDLRVTPEGTIQAPGLGSVFVQGLTIEELRTELEARYAATFGPGLLVSPSLTERATSYVFVGGEVVAPGRYTLEGPTTVMQAIALAGGWNNGGNTREVVVFRRDENWCLKATKINVHKPLYGKDPCPVNDVWLRDNDLVIVPKTRILCAADVIELYFTRGVYAVFPITFVKDFQQGSTVVPVP